MSLQQFVKQKEMKTIGGHTIKNLKRLDPPVLTYDIELHVYGGKIRNDYTLEWQECTWNSIGHVINRNLPKYDIDVLEAEQHLILQP